MCPFPSAIRGASAAVSAARTPRITRRGGDYIVTTVPPSMRISEPVVFAERSLAKNSVRSATSCGVVNRRVAESATAEVTTSSDVTPPALANCAAIPSSARTCAC